MRRTAPASGFTLVELLVVIGIIAVLISILLPTLNRARAAANTVACLSNMRQIGVATRQYADEFNGTLPLLVQPNFMGNFNWFKALSPYLGKDTDFSTSSRDVAALLSACPEWGDVPANLADGGSRIGYGMNMRMMFGQGRYPTTAPTGRPAEWWITNMVFDATNLNGSDRGLGPTKFTSYKQSTTTVLAGDSDNWMLELYFNAATNRWEFRTAANAAAAGLTDIAPGSRWYKADPTRHNRQTRANYVYLDGHAQSLPPEEARRNLLGLLH